MGFFNFLSNSKKSETTEEVKQNNFSDFFNIDIKDIFKYNPELSETETTNDGRVIERYSMNITKKELGIFSNVQIIKISPDSYNLSFSGKCKEPTKELNNFIRFAVNEYGLDSEGRGSYTAQELKQFQVGGPGMIERYWQNGNSAFNICQDVMERDTLTMTIWGCRTL